MAVTDIVGVEALTLVHPLSCEDELEPSMMTDVLMSLMQGMQGGGSFHITPKS